VFAEKHIQREYREFEVGITLETSITWQASPRGRCLLCCAGFHTAWKISEAVLGMCQGLRKGQASLGWRRELQCVAEGWRQRNDWSGWQVI